MTGPSPSRRQLFQLLSADTINDVHDDSLTILERVGVSVKNSEALLLLKNAGCQVDTDRKTARIPRDLVKECLGRTAPALKLFGRDGRHEQTVGMDSIVFNPGSSAIYFSDHRTGEIRQPFSRDLVDLVKLADALRYIHAQSTAMVPSDVPNEIGDLYRLYLVLKNSTKGVITGAFTKEGLADMKRLLEAVAGGEDRLASKPMAVFDVCPSSPLTWGDTACQNLIDCARYKIPAEIIPAPQMGATSPVTQAGTLVQSNAEFLSGLVISQVTKPGAPVIYGGSPTTFDMRHLSSCLGSIENIMVACAAAQIARFYKLPSQAYLGLSDSKALDVQSGVESGFGMVLAALAGVNVVSGPGMLVFENCQSLEKLAVDNEICGMVLRLAQGITVNTETCALNVVANVGPGGNYLGERHTREWLMKEHFMPSDVFDRSTLEVGRKLGSKDAVGRARETVDRVLRENAPDPLPMDVESDLKKALVEIMGRYGIGSVPIL